MHHGWHREDRQTVAHVESAKQISGKQGNLERRLPVGTGFAVSGKQYFQIFPSQRVSRDSFTVRLDTNRVPLRCCLRRQQDLHVLPKTVLSKQPWMGADGAPGLEA